MRTILPVRPFLLALALTGCPASPKDSADPTDSGGDSGDSGGGDSDSGGTADADADGFVSDVDCDDQDPDVHPEAAELCNGVDDDCDADVDEDAIDTVTYYTDADGDGAGDPASAYAACASDDPTTGTDCDDLDAAVFPGAAEVCNGLDDDCDAATVEDGLVQIGNVPYGSVQAALGAALDGDTVDVCGGTYTEALTISRSLTLRSALGADGTTIDAAGLGPAIEVAGGDVVVEGFTLTGGVGVEREGLAYGGGVYAYDASSVTLTDCVVTGNEADRGGGVVGPLMGTLTISGGSISGNEASTAGGGLQAGAVVTLTDVELLDNESFDGGGLFLPANATVTLSGVRVGNNAASGAAGGAYVASGASLTSDTTTWDGNRAVSYGGAAYIVDAAWTLTGDTFDANSSDNKGGHVYADAGASMTATDTSFVGGSGTWGGAIMLYTATFVGERTTFQYNVSDLGGALYVYISSAVTLTDSTVEGNVSGAGAGARVRTTSSLTSVNTGWGTGATDNSPDDIDVVSGETYSTFGAAETFTCTNTTGTCE